MQQHPQWACGRGGAVSDLSPWVLEELYVFFYLGQGRRTEQLLYIVYQCLASKEPLLSVCDHTMECSAGFQVGVRVI